MDWTNCSAPAPERCESPPLVLTRCYGYGFGAANDLKCVSAAAVRLLNGDGARAPSVPPLIRDWIKLSSLWSCMAHRSGVELQTTPLCVSHHPDCNACTIVTIIKYIRDAPRMFSKSAPPPGFPRTLQSMYARIDPARCGDHKFTFIPGADGAGGESSSHSLSQSSPDQAQSRSFL